MPPRPKLDAMERSLTALRKSKQRSKNDPPILIPQKVQKTTVATYLLNKDMRWSVAWVRAWQRKHTQKSNRDDVCINTDLVRAWCTKWESDDYVLQILTEINNKDRILIDIFLMESLVFEFVQANSCKGISVPSSEVIAKYIKLWSFRPRPPSVETNLKRLQDDMIYRKNWARSFRKRWNIAWGTCTVAKPLSRDDLRKKV